MKKVFLMMTAIVAVMGLVTFVACDKDDDKKEDNTEKKEQQEQQDAIPQGYVDLGLESGTLWKDQNEEEFYSYDDAVSTFGDKLPTKEQLEELKTKCQWTWDSTNKGYTVTGSNGNSIFLPAAGFLSCYGSVTYVGSGGYYWSSTPDASSFAWYLCFDSGEVDMDNGNRCLGLSVRLVYHE